MEKTNIFISKQKESKIPITMNIINKREDILNDENYKKLYDSFNSLFYRHGINLKDTFDNDVWFLTNYENKKENSLTPKETNKLLEIISDINLHKFRSQNKSLKVDVGTFLYKISESLIDYSRIINRSIDNIKKYNIDGETNLIQITLELLKNKIDQRSFPNLNPNSSFSYKTLPKSKVNFSISKIENFPNGEYVFRILIKEVNLLENSKEKELYLDLNEKIKFSRENHTLITHKKFPQFEFSFCDEEMYNQYPFSGSTFLTYQIVCEKSDLNYEKKIFKSPVKSFLDFVLGNLAEIRNLVKDTITKNYPVKLNYDEQEEYLINLDFSVQLDDMTRMGILNRLNSLFKEVLRTKSENEKKIDELIEFFPEIKDEVKSILELNYVINERNGSCCECRLF